MKRLLVLLTLPMLACEGLAESISPTITPLSSPALPVFTQPPPSSDSSLTHTPTTPPAALSVTAFPEAGKYEWRLIADGLTRPVDLQGVSGDSSRLYVIEKAGRIRIIENGELLPQPFLDITDRVGSESNEQGLLGFDFFPSADDQALFVNYTNQRGDTVISRFLYGAVADPASETILLTISQPYPNHNGGAVAFGPDGYLYLALGDGGLAGDPHQHGQNINSLLGKILRLDVKDFNVPNGYTIPSDNPFGSEVWAYGLRNPWRISFDQQTGDLWIGDVGQGDWEEIDFLPAGSAGGGNFGWNLMEGSHAYEGPLRSDLLLPVAEYSHASGDGCSVTGGYVYRGSQTEWNGVYLFGDYCTGVVWGIIPSQGGWQTRRLFETGRLITSLGQDPAGEIYLITDSGEVYRLETRQ